MTIEEVEEARQGCKCPLVCLLLAEQSQHRLGADHPNREAVVVLARLPVRPDELRCGNRLELAAPTMEDEVDVRERLESRAEARHRLSHTLRHRADPAVRLGVEVKHAIGLSEPNRPENDGFCAVRPSGHVRSLGTAPVGTARAAYAL